MKIFRKMVLWAGLAALLAGMPASRTGGSEEAAVQAVAAASDKGLIEAVSTDKAAYRPRETVRFRLRLNSKAGKGKLVVQYRHLADIVGRNSINGPKGGTAIEWDWNAPPEDFRGYLVEMFWNMDGKIADHMNIAVDVSSDWGKFPRYGYLADFGALGEGERRTVVDRLNRYHLNGIQFYDWQWKHQMPMKLDNSGKPAAEWPDIANRTVKLETVQGYIDLLHERDIKAMNYNLLFGAYEQYERDGVKPEWGLYRDPLHENQDRHPLPDTWASDILIMNPGNPDWLRYLFGQEKKVFAHLPFDGWHVDQLGHRGTLFDYAGKSVSLMLSYGEMLKQAKRAIGVDYVMNAVDQYGQPLIAKAPVKFLYSELWDGYARYVDLKRAIDENGKFSHGRLNTVLAAYMNYDLADRAGTFNAPGVLLTNAVIFASGGAHIEIGENMLAKEYFPNRSLRIPPALEKRLTVYYDFLTAYENVLRDSVEEADGIRIDSDVFRISASPESGKVWFFAKRKGAKRIVHLLNFKNTVGMEWKDGLGRQQEPETMKNVLVDFQMKDPVNRIWFASPDAAGGSPEALPFEQKNGRVKVTLPSLQYWDMIVLE